MLKVGLLGAGRIGQVHARAIASHADSALAAVSDANAEAAQGLAARHGAAARTTEAILADPAIDAVLIATPTDTHAALIEAASAAGKAILCEKPVDLSLDRAIRCREAVGARGAQIMIGFNRRFDPSFAALKAAADRGEIGKTEMLAVTSFDPAPPPVSYVKASGGLFRDMMIHDFDMAMWIMGAAPETVTAVGAALVDPAIGAAGDVDTAVATLRFADGRLAVIRNSRRAAYGYDQRLELLGSEGLLQADNVLENTVVRSTAAGVTGAKPTWFFLERYMPAYAAEWDAFVQAVRAGAAPPVTLQDGINALALAEAATRSAATGATVAVTGAMPVG